MRKTIIVFLMVLLALTSVFAGYYAKGDSEFSVRLGAEIPAILFRPFYNSSLEDIYEVPGSLLYGSKIGSKIGGNASLAYQIFTKPNLCIGGEVGFDFLYTTGKDFMSLVPITFKATFVTAEKENFNLNINLNAGIAILKYRESRYFPAPYLKATINPVWFFTRSWGMGAETGFSATAELWGTNSSNYKHEKSVVAGFVPITLTAIYRH